MEVFVPYDIQINSIVAPASKSYAQRAIMASALSDSSVSLINPGSSSDVLNMLEVVKKMGANVLMNTNSTEIIGRQKNVENVINCGESGLGSRLTIIISSLFNKKIKINGSGSLLKRPMNDFENIFQQLGIGFSSNNGYLPIEVNGNLSACDIHIDGSLSSQYLSGLLMALPIVEGKSTIRVNELNSRPYIDMTIQLLNDFGINITNNNYNQFIIPGNQKYISPKNYKVEGDWSGAAFWIVYGAIKDNISISGLNPNSLQADKAILVVLDKVGAKYEWNNGALNIYKNTLNPFKFDATNCPDLFPILAVLAASCNGTSSIKGLGRLEFKESDRGQVLKNEFSKLGLKIELKEDEMIVYGTGSLLSGTIHAHNDHRIAMSGAIASILTDGGINISDAQSVVKSYPEFWELI